MLVDEEEEAGLWPKEGAVLVDKGEVVWERE